MAVDASNHISWTSQGRTLAPDLPWCEGPTDHSRDPHVDSLTVSSKGRTVFPHCPYLIAVQD